MMQYKVREPGPDTEALIRELEPVADGLGFSVVELALFRKKAARIRLVVARKGDNSGEGTYPGGIGTEELAMIHRTVLPRLELALEGRDLYLEVSSPGTDRLIKEGAEFRHFTGKPVKCWITGGTDWERGILRGSDETKILLETAEGVREIKYDAMAKARLDL